MEIEAKNRGHFRFLTEYINDGILWEICIMDEKYEQFDWKNSVFTMLFIYHFLSMGLSLYSYIMNIGRAIGAFKTYIIIELILSVVLLVYYGMILIGLLTHSKYGYYCIRNLLVVNMIYYIIELLSIGLSNTSLTTIFANMGITLALNILMLLYYYHRMQLFGVKEDKSFIVKILR